MIKNHILFLCNLRICGIQINCFFTNTIILSLILSSFCYKINNSKELISSGTEKGRDIMKIFIDTANVEHIREANDLGVICGVTTNPSLIAKEGRDFVEVVKEITTIVDGPISAEVISLEHEGMVKEARELVKIHKNIVIKIPMTLEGLRSEERRVGKECARTV